MSRGMIGLHHSEVTKQKQSATMRRQWEDPRYRAKITLMAHERPRSAEAKASMAVGQARRQQRSGISKLQRAMTMMLFIAGYHVCAQEVVGNYCVDVFDPTRMVVFEADGSYHDPDKQQARDETLTEDFELAVIHLDANDLKPFMSVRWLLSL